MSADKTGMGTRERVWVDKVDKTVDPPVLVERVAVENGRVIEVLPGDAVPDDERAEALRRAQQEG